jgi:hypothetical protein
LTELLKLIAELWSKSGTADYFIRQTTVFDGKKYREGRADAEIRANRQASAVFGDDAVADGQIESGSSADFFGRKERLEDLRKIFRRDADAGILNFIRTRLFCKSRAKVSVRRSASRRSRSSPKR